MARIPQARDDLPTTGRVFQRRGAKTPVGKEERFLAPWREVQITEKLNHSIVRRFNYKLFANLGEVLSDSLALPAICIS